MLTFKCHKCSAVPFDRIMTPSNIITFVSSLVHGIGYYLFALCPIKRSNYAKSLLECTPIPVGVEYFYSSVMPSSTFLTCHESLVF